MINVTKSFLPPIEEYQKYIKQIWTSAYLTNQGPLLRELEQKLKQYLGVENFHYVSNGTIALQLALRALDITDGEVITTPFSFVATTTSILWERCVPVFVDIEPDSFCIDVKKIEEAITKKTRAIMAVHVFGLPCNVEEIAKIAKKHDLKVIYDAAHAFGAEYNGRSLLSFGDISTCSFHATKVFHTVEGGACIVNEDAVSNRLELIKRFGYNADDYQEIGINAKNSEFHAAMGLANFKYIDEVIMERKRASNLYDELLAKKIKKPSPVKNLKPNFAYYPILFEDQDTLVRVLDKLKLKEIFARRYFYPSLNTLPYVSQFKSCPISENIASRIACLPLYPDLQNEDVVKISDIVNSNI